MLLPLTQGLVAAAMLLAVVALGYALFDKLINDWLLGLAALVGVGGVVYFAVAWVIGGINRDDILILLRRKKVEA